ncbi:MAG: preprotein translocase subunit SecG [Bacteroidales bacterium]|nr:preprotein translocase subunit SecG [Bacteroidales bacterium]
MYIAIIVLIIFVAVLLGIVVLLQNSKGGGLASEFSSSNQIMGVRRTADFLEKTTWTLAIALVVLSFITCFMGRSAYQKKAEGGSKAQQGQSVEAPMNQPAAAAAPEAAPVETAPVEAE